jgi:pheromone shutdown protein TraB
MERPVLLVGTAHVVDLADPLRRVLTGRDLQGIALELDSERLEALLRGPGAGGGRSGVPFFVRLWGVIQQRLGQEIGSGAGAEMKAAAGLAREWEIPVFLIDDPIRETIVRLVRSLSFRERILLVVGSIAGLFVPARVVKEQVAEYRESPGTMLEAMRTEFPGVTRVLLDDRNEHMADRLVEVRRRGYGRVAAVVGDAHVPGLGSALERRGVPVERVRFAELVPTAPSPGSPRPS